MLLCQCGPKSEDCFQHLVESSVRLRTQWVRWGVCGAGRLLIRSSVLQSLLQPACQSVLGQGTEPRVALDTFIRVCKCERLIESGVVACVKILIQHFSALSTQPLNRNCAHHLIYNRTIPTCTAYPGIKHLTLNQCMCLKGNGWENFTCVLCEGAGAHSQLWDVLFL